MSETPVGVIIAPMLRLQMAGARPRASRRVYGPAERGAFVVVRMLPLAEGVCSASEVAEVIPAPEFLVIDPIAALNFPVLLGPRGWM